MKLSNALRWIALNNRFLVQQLAVRALTVGAGLWLLRTMPVKDYGLFTIAYSAATLVAVGANFGFTSSLITLGSKGRSSVQALSNLLFSVKKHLAAALPVSAAAGLWVFCVMAANHEPNTARLWTLSLFVLWIGCAQLAVVLQNAVLNVHHDADGQFRAGICAAVIQLLLVGTAGLLNPGTETGLAIYGAAGVLNAFLLAKMARSYVAAKPVPDPETSREVRRFVLPILP